jgi:gluconolactonase
LYVADTGGSHQPGGPRHIRALRLSSDGLRVESSRIFAECSQGFFDGFRVDERDRIWASAADGVHAYLPDGTLLGKVLIPEVVANVCFGGIKRNRLFICGTSSLYCVDLDTTGLSGR